MIGFKEINIGGYVLRFFPTDNSGWMCGITDEQLKALMSITKLYSHAPQTKLLSDEEIGEVYEELYEMKLLDEYPLKFARTIEAKVRGEK